MSAYPLLVGLGATLGLAWVAQRAPHRQATAWVDAGLWALAGALLGARVAYAAGNWARFAPQPLEVLQVWGGGLAWPGALAGGLLGMALWAWIHAAALPRLADGLLPLLPPLLVGIWLGCWQAGVAYGALQPGVPWALPIRDEWGVLAPRWPLQPAEALVSLAFFAALDLLRLRLRHPGLAASLALAGLALLLLGAALLRADPYPRWLGVRLDTAAALAFLALGIAGGLLAIFAGRGKVRDPLTDKIWV